MRKEITGQTFGPGIVQLDGKDFDRCRFDGCTLVYYGGGHFTFTECEFPRVDFRFEDAAERTLTTLRLLKQNGYAGFVDSVLATIDAPFDAATRN